MYGKIVAYIVQLASRISLGVYRRYSVGRFSVRAGRFAVAAHIVVSQRFQYAPTTLIRAYQTRRLKRLFDARLEELKGKPILSKQELKERNDRGEPAFARSRYEIAETTGSTGVPLRVFWDKNYSPMNAAVYCRAFLEHGSNLSEGKICIGVRSRYWLEPRNVFWISTRDLYRDPDAVAKFFARNQAEMTKVRVLEGYPSHFWALAKLLERKNIPVPQLKLLLYTGEELLPHDRSRLESAYGGKIFGFYGLTEAGIVGLECEKHRGFHIEEWRYVVEVVDDAGAPAENGSWGRILLTALYNEVMPLLRYDTGDLGMISPEPCGCGRKSPVLVLMGRRGAEVLLADGGRIHMFLLEQVLQKYADAVWRYQLIQRFAGELEVKIVPARAFGRETAVHLTKDLAAVLGRGARVYFSIVEDIALEPHEKFRTFVSLIGGSRATGRSLRTE